MSIYKQMYHHNTYSNFFYNKIDWIATLLLCMIGIFNGYLSTQKYGIGLISDSYAYLKMAENFALSGQLICYEGYTFSLWPPLYPILLSIPIYFGIESLQAALLLNMLAYCLALCLAYHCLLPFAITKFLRMAIFFVVVGFYPLCSEANFAMTDMLFLSFCLFFAWCSQNYNGTPKALLLLSLAVALAWLLRYVGVVLCVVGLLVVLLYHPKKITNKLFAAFLYLIIATTPMIIWLLYNYFTNGHFYGERTWGNGHKFYDNLKIISGYMSFQLLPFQLAKLWQFTGLLLFISMLVYFVYFQPNIFHPKAKRLLVVYLIFSVVYWFLLILLSVSAAFVPMYLRYLTPTSYLIIILVFAFWVHLLNFIDKLPYKTLRKVCYFVTIFLTSIWILQHLRSTVKHTIARYQWGTGGYTSYDFMQSDFQLWLNKQNFEGFIFTNVLHLAYTHLTYTQTQKTQAEVRLLLDENQNFTPAFLHKKGRKIAFIFHILPTQDFKQHITHKILYQDNYVTVYELR